jgi:hypothetical protein
MFSDDVFLFVRIGSEIEGQRIREVCGRSARLPHWLRCPCGPHRLRRRLIYSRTCRARDHRCRAGRCARGLQWDCLFAGAQEAWREKQRHDYQRGDRHPLPSDRAEAVGIGQATEADYLFGREIRQQERAGNDRESQLAPIQEKALGTLDIILAGEKPLQTRSEGGEPSE